MTRDNESHILSDADVAGDYADDKAFWRNFTADESAKVDPYNMKLTAEYVAPSTRKGPRVIVRSGGIQRTFEYDRMAMDPYIVAARLFAGSAAERVFEVDRQTGKRTYEIDRKPRA